MLPYVIITDVDIGSVKSSFDKHLVYMQVKLEHNCTVGNIRNSEFFGKKMLIIFEKGLTPFWRRLCNKNSCSILINGKTITFHCFKDYGSPTCSQVKSYTKRGIPNNLNTIHR